MGSYRNLEVWQVSIDFVEKLYVLTKAFPKEELYGLTSQIRRAAVSISANIAEGSARGTQKDFRHFLSMAYGSCCEVETLCEICFRTGILRKEDTETLEKQLGSISRMLKALRKSMED